MNRSQSNVVELRQYLLHPGQREILIALFDREFVETQEAVGMTLLAQFRDLDHPDHFTWLRGFPDMPSRAASLGAFYDGPVWARFRNDANATMISSDDVRLLRPACAGWPLGDRDVSEERRPLVVATIYPLTPSGAAGFKEFFERSVTPKLMSMGAQPFAMFETEPSINTWPRLPVREGKGERCFVWFARFDDAAEHARHVASLAGDVEWTSEILPALEQRLAAPAEMLRLEPTARSRSLP